MPVVIRRMQVAVSRIYARDPDAQNDALELGIQRAFAFRCITPEPPRYRAGVIREEVSLAIRTRQSGLDADLIAKDNRYDAGGIEKRLSQHRQFF